MTFWILVISVCLGDMTQKIPFQQKFESKQICELAEVEAHKAMADKPELWAQFSCRETECIEVKP